MHHYDGSHSYGTAGHGGCFFMCVPKTHSAWALQLPQAHGSFNHTIGLTITELRGREEGGVLKLFSKSQLQPAAQNGSHEWPNPVCGQPHRTNHSSMAHPIN